MSTDREQHRAAALPLQTLLGERVITTARSLRPEQWDGPTNCPPWIVKTIVAHLVRNAEMFNVMLDTGLSGGQTFPQTPTEREERQKELAAMPSETLISTFETSHANLRDRLSRLTLSELEQPCPHPRWLMPAWWVVDQRVVELAFHSWDMDTSIGREAEIDGRVAQFMLPAILENNLPLFHRSSPAGRTWAIHAGEMDGGHWLIQSSEGAARISHEDGAAEVSISGDAAALVRWLYGRADIPALESAGRINLEGDPDGMAAWRETFPSP
jgi:uncharacterized protein (TIGR03083 family)